MTRFARGSGSKGSNERQPEEATSWQEMKKQMIKRKYQVEANEAGLKAFEQRGQLKNERTSSKETTWAEFENESTKKDKNLEKSSIKKNKEKKSKGITNEKQSDSPKKKKENTLVNSQTIKKRKKKSEYKITGESNEINKSKKNIIKFNKKSEKVNLENVESKKLNSPKKRKLNENKSDENNDSFQKSNKIKIKHPFAKKEFNNKKLRKEHNKLGGKRKAELTGGKVPWKKRKTESEETVMFINGEKILVVKYDGFQIQKKDAEALDDLKIKLKEQGISKEEIDKTLKLARRRAEKSLARVRKSVCFHCRKSGHLLSDCPEIEKGEERPVAGVCYKCGSTEHSYLQCKVSKNSGFRFAECFICKEQGHIARECPDNPRGLYPKGGACKLCGDVTHFKKDCPTAVEAKQSNKITLSRLDDDEDQQLAASTSPVKKKKIIKF